MLVVSGRDRGCGVGRKHWALGISAVVRGDKNTWRTDRSWGSGDRAFAKCYGGQVQGSGIRRFVAVAGIAHPDRCSSTALKDDRLERSLMTMRVSATITRYTPADVAADGASCCLVRVACRRGVHHRQGCGADSKRSDRCRRRSRSGRLPLYRRAAGRDVLIPLPYARCSEATRESGAQRERRDRVLVGRDRVVGIAWPACCPASLVRALGARCWACMFYLDRSRASTRSAHQSRAVLSESLGTRASGGLHIALRMFAHFGQVLLLEAVDIQAALPPEEMIALVGVRG